MKYNPKDASSAIPPGWYNATIESTEDRQTKKGDDMQVVTFRVYGTREITVKEFFHPASLWKYKALAKALGQLPEFNQASFDAADFLRKSIDIELLVEDSPEYGEQNRIKAFAPDGEKAGVSPRPPSSQGGFVPPADATIDHDDIPF